MAFGRESTMNNMLYSFILLALILSISHGFAFTSPLQQIATAMKSYQDEMLSEQSSWKQPPHLAVLTEPDACDSIQRVNETYRAIEQATLDGNVDLVVVRITDDSMSLPKERNQKNANKLEMLQRLSRLKSTREKDSMAFKLIINNDIEMAIAALSQSIPIDGMHVKERNIESITSIRQQLQNAAAKSGLNNVILMGTSCHSVKSAMDSHELVDYLFVGTCYLTRSHPEKNQDQLEGPQFPSRIKEELARIIPNPLSAIPIIFAIGGIDETNCHEPVLYGADGVGVIRSIMKAADPRSMSKCIKKSISDARGKIENE